MHTRASSESPVRQVFRGAGVFVTGSTDWLEQLLLEKLLRACPDVKNVFLLVRSKKEKTEIERFAEIFEGEVSLWGRLGE
jgi:fatty acyl-CoA reductase